MSNFLCLSRLFEGSVELSNWFKWSRVTPPVDLNVMIRLVFRYVFIPWLQQELNSYRDIINNTGKRADRNKILPHGVLNNMYEHPNGYGVLDFKVIDLFAYISFSHANEQIKIRQDAIDTGRNLYAPRDHKVFQLVPPDFSVIISQLLLSHAGILNRFHGLDDIYNLPAISM
ncbi:hypothetical protein K438DRAFT_1764135 [Mycena galopus ATCC 62051]|nr:hypothetical protein K438DRAFT_1764135 [Mycena galopus ATCC 62051]